MSNRSFPVDIGDNLTVGHLKDGIMKKNLASFDGVDSYTIELWKVSGFPIYVHNLRQDFPSESDSQATQEPG